jgi:hypothetical protein
MPPLEVKRNFSLKNFYFTAYHEAEIASQLRFMIYVRPRSESNRRSMFCRHIPKPTLGTWPSVK